MGARRQDVLRTVAEAIAAAPADPVTRVAIDGVDGAGKTCFADELGLVLRAMGRAVIRASVDGFHNPKVIRYRRGRSSPEGFFYDSYDYAQLGAALLDPLGPGGSRRYRVAVFDHVTDHPVDSPARTAGRGDILLLDGIFLHRPELRARWDYSIFLEVAFAVSVPRGAQRDGSSPDPGAAGNRRYVEGQKLYLETCDPAQRASVVVNNDDLDAPYLVEPLRGPAR